LRFFFRRRFAKHESHFPAFARGEFDRHLQRSTRIESGAVAPVKIEPA
jgi:hypothetical protein